MAEKLIFPVGFDLDAAVKEAADAWASKYQAQLEKAIQKKPLNVRVGFDAKQLNNLEAVQKRLAEVKLMPITPETREAIKSLVRELKNLETILKRIDRLNAANARSTASASAANELAAQRAARTAEIQQQTASRAKQDAEKLAILEERKKRAIISTAEAERRRAEAANRTSAAYRTQEGYVNRLIKRTAILFSIGTVMNFARQLREVTAEFELQRVSLGAIIQDTQKANELFSRIKTFAVQSPFEIKDLVSYVKQLSAYRIATEDLFDTTKRLADVSAGLGVDMQRIILAYGQVRAASVLRGQEVRQFTEAGIPLVELLAEKFSKLRGEMVSTGEVFDLISNRAVSFEMVKEIFEDMTDAGGMFYNMQEKQAKTLAGQWSNLKDSYSIMLDEMGNTTRVRGAMELIIEGSKSAMENWQLFYGLLNDIAGGFVLYKIYGGIKNFVGAFKTSVLGSYNKYAEAARKATLAEKMYNAAMQSGTATQQVAARARLNLANATLTAARAEAYAARQTNLLAYAWKKFTTFLKANWVLLAISAIVALGEAIAHAVRKANELKNALKEIESEGRVNMEKTVYNFERLADKAVDAADGSKEQRQALEELQRTYKNMIPTHLLTIDNLRKMAGNYDNLTRSIREYSQQQIYAQQVDEVIAQTTKKIIKQQDTVREYLENLRLGRLVGDTTVYDNIGLNEYQIADFFSNIEKYAKDTSLTVEDIIKNSLEGIVDDASAATLIKNNHYVQELVKSQMEQNKQLSLLENKQKAATGELGRYNEMLQETTAAIEAWKDTNENLKIQSPTLYNEALVKETTSQYEQLLREIFDKAGVAFQDSFVKNGILDMASIGNAMIEAGNAFDASATFVFRKMQKTYEEIVPSRATVTNLRNAFREIAETLKVNLDNVNQDMIQSDEVLKNYAERVEKTIKELKSGIQEHELNLASQTLTGSQVESEEAALQRAKERLSVLEQMYEITKLFGSGKTGENSQLAMLNALAEEVDNLHKRYEEYRNYLGDTAAEKRVQEVFGTTLSVLRQYGIELPRTAEEYKEAIATIIALMSKLANSEKDVIKMKFKYDDVDFQDQKLQFEKEIKRLGDEVSKTKTAKDFFQNMLNLTGDKDLSATITMSVYGDTGDDLAKNMVKQVEAAFKGVDISSAIGKDGFIDYLQLEDMLDKVPEEYREAARKIVEEGKKSNADIMKTFLNVMTNYDGIAQQRINIEQEAARKIAQIDEGLAIYRNQLEKERTTLGEKETNNRIAAAQERADKAKEGVYSEEKLGLLKLKDNYIRFFGAIHTMTEKEATTLRNDLRQALFDAFQKGALSADELRRELKTVDEQFDKLINDVGFFGTYMLRGIDGLIQRIRDLADETVEVAGEISQMSNPDQITDAQKSFIDDILKRFGNSDTGKSFKELFDKAGGDTKKMAENLQKVIESMGNIASKGTGLVSVFDAIIQAIGSTVSGIGEIRDMLNSVRSEEMDNGFWRAFEYIEAYNNSLQEMWQRLKSGDIIGAAFSIVKFFVSIFTIRHQQKVKKLNKEIEKQEKIIHDLDRAYQKLEKSAEKLFGDAFLNNYEQQQKNLQAQIEATQKQLDAERAKGKSADKEKVQEYEDTLDDLQQKSDELRESLGEHFLGESLESAARSFADSWLEAYEQFGDTRKALEDSMHDMMMNLIKEAVFGAVMKTALEPLYDYLETLDAGDFALQETWDTIGELMETVINVADIGSKNAADLMEKWGVLSREMGGDLTGISKDIATASEESILGLAAGINTQNFYISGIYTTVMQMYAIMRGGTIDETTTGISLTDLITLQNQYLSSLPTIAQNTAEIITRAERAAIACEDIATNINRIVKPTGVKGSYTLKAEIQ